MTFRSNHDQGLNDFNGAIDAQYEKGVALMRKTQLFALEEVIETSPVDKSIYRASHDLTVDSPSTLEQREPGNGAQATAEGKARLRARLTARRLKAELRIDSFVANHLKYATAIEGGHSQQAPNGVYGLAEIKTQRVWSRESAKLSRENVKT